MSFLLFAFILLCQADTVGNICKDLTSYYSKEEHTCTTTTNCLSTNITEEHFDEYFGCSQCNVGYYYTTDGGCAKCEGCENSDCKNEIGCERCPENYILEVQADMKRGKCVLNTNVQSSCEEYGSLGCTKCKEMGTIIIDGICTDIEGCTDAGKVENGCTECKSGFYLKNNICIQCDSHCTECNNKTGVCIECWEGYHPLENSVKCYACDSKCANCSQTYSPNNHYCLDCEENYFLVDDHCVRCPDGCTGENCQDGKGCVTCDSNDYFFVPSDSFSHYSLGNTTIGMCVPKQSSCEINDIEKRCTQCKPGFTLVDGLCNGAFQTVTVLLCALLMLLAF